MRVVKPKNLFDFPVTMTPLENSNDVTMTGGDVTMTDGICHSDDLTPKLNNLNLTSKLVKSSNDLRFNKFILWNLPQISSSAKLVALCISNVFNKKDGYCYPSVSHLSRMSNLSTSTVSRATKELRELGLIRVKRRYNSSNVYELYLPEDL